MEKDCGAWINLLSHRVKARLDAAFQNLGITGVQSRVIYYILAHCKEGPVYQRDIENAFSLSRSTATGILQLLEKNGIILRESVSNDARLKSLVPTRRAFELTARETARLGGTLPRGLMVYGRQALMLVRNCPLANSPKGCLHCRKPGCLTDRKRKKFPVVCRDGESAEVLNSVPLWLGDLEKELVSLDFGVARFTVENSVECGRVLDALFRGETPDFDYTRGLFHRGVE